MISGCSYSSARNISLQSFAFILIGDLVFGKPDNNEIQNGNIYNFSDYTFPRYMTNGSFACDIRTLQEIFTSNATTLYNQPGIVIF